MPRSACLLALASLCSLLVEPSAVFAQPAREPLQLPPALSPWAAWVLHGHERSLCPAVDGEHLCAWPSVLSLEVDAAGGRFALDVFLDRRAAVSLPGSSTRWPQAVRLDGGSAVVLAGPDGRPQVSVEPGAHRLTGELRWSRLPESIVTPPATGRVELRLEGAAAIAPRRDANGRVWLTGERAVADRAQRLDLEVHRRVDDGVPTQLTTRLLLSVGGRSREAALTGAVLPDTRAVDLVSSLPARIEPDGTLRLQVSPGEHQVEIHAVRAAPPDRLTAPAAGEPWAEREIWVVDSDPQLRELELSGPGRIDPARTNLAEDWRELPTFVLQPGDELRFETKRRGQPASPPNELSLARQLWLDLDGTGFTVRDRISGVLRRDFRLALQQGQLGRAQLGDRDQLITVHDGRPGLELRDEQLRLLAEWRLERSGGSLPAVAWSSDMESVDANLRLPPGWTLLGGSGAGIIEGTLLADWDLWDFFFVLLVALATAKLAGWPWGAVALLTLASCMHQPRAPEGIWLWLLAALALARLSLSGGWKRATRGLLGLSLLAAVLAFIPFAVQQLRGALYPQVERGATGPGRPEAAPLRHAVIEEEAAMESDAASAPVPAPESSDMSRDKVLRSLGGAAQKAGGYQQRARSAQRAIDQLDPGTLVQTGPGVPDWHWASHRLGFDGPVQQDQKLSLWLLPPWLTRLLALLRVLLGGALLWGLTAAALRGVLHRRPLAQSPP